MSLHAACCISSHKYPRIMLLLSPLVFWEFSGTVAHQQLLSLCKEAILCSITHAGWSLLSKLYGRNRDKCLNLAQWCPKGISSGCPILTFGAL